MALLQALLSGLALGGIYALVALGFSITHTTTKTLNFGQGEVLVAGAFVAVGSLLLLAGKPYTAVLTPSDVTIGRYLLALAITIIVVGLIVYIYHQTYFCSCLQILL
jgi:branched-chain amino acid transport system permease protein